MASLIQRVSKWEIQLLVLLSFMLQAFLFLCGYLRRRSSNRFFMLLVWIAYLGSDLVATYALGVISRHDNDDATAGSRESHQLVFLWVPFLLIHLGGQDTLTAFALEDNNLWLRHLLNLGVQVSLVLYLFWKLANNSGTDARFLVLNMLLFVTGTIKYGERTWALRSGVLKTLAQEPLPFHAHELRGALLNSNHLANHSANQPPEQIKGDVSSSDDSVLAIALCSIESVRSFFWHNESFKLIHPVWSQEHQPAKVLKILEAELGLVYDYIYTKAVVFQTTGGIILRCISQIAFLASFLLFILCNRQRYNSIDTAVTYALFVGGFFLEVCAVLTTVRSPWTWACLKTQGYSPLASVFFRWQRKVKSWSHSMGQYNMHNYLGQYNQSSSWKHRVMATVRKVVDASCGVEQKFWVSKLLDIRFIEVDQDIIECIFQKVVEYTSEPRVASPLNLPQLQTNLNVLLEKVLRSSNTSDGTLNWLAIATLHTYTEAQLRMYSPSPSDVGNESTRALVSKISRYIVYLLAMQSEMLPVSRDAQNKDPRDGKTETNGAAGLANLNMIKLDGTANYFATAAGKADGNSANKDHALLIRARKMLTDMGLPDLCLCTHKDLLETKEAWMRLLIYIAGRSRPELHATRLCRGGELLTFIWLFMAQRGLGDSVLQRIEATDFMVPSLVLFRFPQNRKCPSGVTAHDEEKSKTPKMTVGMEVGSDQRDSLPLASGHAYRSETTVQCFGDDFIRENVQCFGGGRCDDRCIASDVKDYDNNNITGQRDSLPLRSGHTLQPTYRSKTTVPSTSGEGTGFIRKSVSYARGDRCDDRCIALDVKDYDNNSIQAHDTQRLKMSKMTIGITVGSSDAHRGTSFNGMGVSYVRDGRCDDQCIPVDVKDDNNSNILAYGAKV